MTSMGRTLSHEEARRVYNRIGSLQDTQAFYEDRATRELMEHGRFEAAQTVFEFGCGTGRFAEALLTERLSSSAAYRGIDVSPTMVQLARKRLSRFATRARIDLSEGGAPVSEPSEHYDRWLSTFVFDLLSEADIDAVLTEAHRMLVPGGLLCVAGLAVGEYWHTKLMAGAWSALHTLSPALVGGCRPIELSPRLAGDRWSIVFRRSLAPFFVPSEVVIAMRR